MMTFATSLFFAIATVFAVSTIWTNVQKYVPHMANLLDAYLDLKSSGAQVEATHDIHARFHIPVQPAIASAPKAHSRITAQIFKLPPAPAKALTSPILPELPKAA